MAPAAAAAATTSDQMKVLVYFSPKKPSDVFEGARLRKNLKGALESAGVSWVDSTSKEPDIVHLLSPNDLKVANEAKRNGRKLVVSAFYCENDPFARFFGAQIGKKQLLKPSSIRMFQEADLILVPTAQYGQYLRTTGLKCPIEVLSAGVNATRFVVTDPIEKTVFYHYFRLDSGKKYVLVVGDYGDLDMLAELEDIALATPTLEFYFLGLSNFGALPISYLKRLNKKTPANLHLSGLTDDDIYRSGLFNATAYLSFPANRPDNLTALEAMAAHCQVFALGSSRFGDVLSPNVNCFSYESPSEVAFSLNAYAQGRLKSTIIEAGKFALENSLEANGRRLLSLYQDLLKDRRNIYDRPETH
jgi:1,2-diacylglycerol-3-alpha-glucose alpha-1,2-glucosyltransferase